MTTSDRPSAAGDSPVTQLFGLGPRVTSTALPRRTVLRGAGALMALPLLEAMVAPVARAGSSHSTPRRLLYVYVPNGVNLSSWRPARVGRLSELPWTLAPLAGLRDEVCVLRGLTQHHGRANGDGPGDHARAAASFLTGVQPLKTEGRVRLGISADQLAAREVGGATRLRSLVLGVERGRQSGQCDSGYACAYSNNLSWQNQTTPVAKETNPRQLFDRLFRGGDGELDAAARAERHARRQSVLDYVREDAAALKNRLGADDRRRVDEYESGVRELERRLALTEASVVDEVSDDARPVGSPGGYAERVSLLAEMIALAFQTDVTRIATLMFANEGSGRRYTEVGVSEGHHPISHHGKDPQKLEWIRRINRFHVQLFAELLHRFRAIDEGSGSLLDASMVVYGSGIGDGNRHDHHDLPLLLAGRGGGSLTPGRCVAYPKNTPLNDLHLALLARMGVRGLPLGDGRGELTGI